MGDEDPGASSGFLFGGIIRVRVWPGLGKDRDTAGAGAGGEVRRVVVEDVDKRDDGCV